VQCEKPLGSRARLPAEREQTQPDDPVEERRQNIQEVRILFHCAQMGMGGLGCRP